MLVPKLGNLEALKPRRPSAKAFNGRQSSRLESHTPICCDRSEKVPMQFLRCILSDSA